MCCRRRTGHRTSWPSSTPVHTGQALMRLPYDSGSGKTSPVAFSVTRRRAPPNCASRRSVVTTDRSEANRNSARRDAEDGERSCAACADPGWRERGAGISRAAAMAPSRCRSPFSRCSVVLARSAACASCVTMMIVLLNSLFSRCSSAQNFLRALGVELARRLVEQDQRRDRPRSRGRSRCAAPGRRTAVADSDPSGRRGRRRRAR